MMCKRFCRTPRVCLSIMYLSFTVSETSHPDPCVSTERLRQMVQLQCCSLWKFRNLPVQQKPGMKTTTTLWNDKTQEGIWAKATQHNGKQLHVKQDIGFAVRQLATGLSADSLAVAIPTHVSGQDHTATQSFVGHQCNSQYNACHCQCPNSRATLYRTGLG